MALILKSSVKLYNYLFEEIADRRTQDWFLMSSPWPGLALLGLYLATVTRWLPAHMSKRPAYEIRPIVAAYNVIQILGCSYVLYQSLVLAWFSHYRLVCQPVDEGPNDIEIAFRVCYGYFTLKLLDLVDTIFFVLRKKQRQVSFLHVYHHTGMVMVSWGMVKWVAGGHTLFLVSLNSFVHIIMYTYYLLTTWDEAYKKSIWWKKHVTQIQILQFTLIFLHFCAAALTSECNFPKPPVYILIPQNLFMVILFADFYYRTYIKPNKTKKES